DPFIVGGFADQFPEPSVQRQPLALRRIFGFLTHVPRKPVELPVAQTTLSRHQECDYRQCKKLAKPARLAPAPPLDNPSCLLVFSKIIQIDSTASPGQKRQFAARLARFPIQRRRRGPGERK